MYQVDVADNAIQCYFTEIPAGDDSRNVLYSKFIAQLYAVVKDICGDPGAVTVLCCLSAPLYVPRPIIKTLSSGTALL